MYEAGTSAVGAFTGAASSGQVTLDPELAADAHREIVAIRQALEGLLNSADADPAGLRLGANPVGAAMARKSADRYHGDDSYLAVVRHLLEQTERAQSALEQSMRNYTDTDTGRAVRFRGQG